ncbi:DUF2793 domain-containing protein [Roseicitreum antarcticum]|uniref:DUF2793 domain-containing protein n=1 Tax=Roseicitreum antarcticum TaxID=564137 RepID=A0A1H3CQK8_9RHOB|nr:DUF2793 domain-containing protein [Roseicitreum antarcticum]SDX56178.1 Protein of unknown function [Roseicitreum antarcticum]
MSDQSARFALPYIQPSQAQKHVTHNAALEVLDLVVQLVVEEFGAATPPALPQDGQIWALGPVPTGAWAGQADMLAAWVENAWRFIAPQPGWRASLHGAAELRVRTQAGWALPVAAAPDLDNLAGVGIGAAADATNRLAVAAPATLLSHAGGDHQLKINKATGDDTASLLFQTGFSGRAEMGTAGNDDFSVKVSPDGAAWLEALRIAAATGVVAFPAGLDAASIMGDGVMAAAGDATPGRVLKLAQDGRGAFGLGSTAAAGPPEITSFTAALIPGLYRYAEATAVGAPGSGGAFAGYALVLGSASGHPGVIAWRAVANAADQRIWFGARTATTGPVVWTALWHQGDLLGTVAQAGGRPSGAVFQHGSSANGRFERRASGWMECIRTDLSVPAVTLAAGSLFRSADVTWTFPQAFLAGEPPVVSIAGVHADAVGASVVALSPAAVTFRLVTHSAIADAVSIRAAARGRWSAMT